MANQSLPDLIRELRLRADGMHHHLTELTDIGLKQADIDAGLAYATTLEKLDSEQEALKAALKAKTAEINEAQQAAKKWVSQVTPRIKLALQDKSEVWVEFGIKANK